VLQHRRGQRQEVCWRVGGGERRRGDPVLQHRCGQRR